MTLTYEGLDSAETRLSVVGHIGDSPHGGDQALFGQVRLLSWVEKMQKRSWSGW